MLAWGNSFGLHGLFGILATNVGGFGKHPSESMSISGLVVEYIVAIDVTRVRFPADAVFCVALLH